MPVSRCAGVGQHFFDFLDFVINRKDSVPQTGHGAYRSQGPFNQPSSP